MPSTVRQQILRFQIRGLTDVGGFRVHAYVARSYQQLRLASRQAGLVWLNRTISNL